MADFDSSESRIRRTQIGDLMPKVCKSSEKSANSFRNRIEKMLSEQADVKSGKQEIVVEDKELDGVISREDVCAR